MLKLVSRTDRELVDIWQKSTNRLKISKSDRIIKTYTEKRDKAALELWNKYFLLRMKKRGELVAICKRNGYINLYQEIFEEYDSWAWEKFLNAIKSVRLYPTPGKTDCSHIKNWTFYRVFWGYLNSMNRDKIKHYQDYKFHNISTTCDSFDSDEQKNIIDLNYAKIYNNEDSSEVQFEVSEVKDLFWKSVQQLRSELTEIQKEMFDLKSNGIRNKQIKINLKITDKEFNQNMNLFRERLEVIVTTSVKKKGYDLNFLQIQEMIAGVDPNKSRRKYIE